VVALKHPLEVAGRGRDVSAMNGSSLESELDRFTL
jgi:hypothetical protein